MMTRLFKFPKISGQISHSKQIVSTSKRILMTLLIVFSSHAFANTTAPETSLNYKIVPTDQIPSNFKVPKGKIMVMEFFSYGCPHCAHLSPYLQQWKMNNANNIVSNTKKNKQAYIIFQAIPVAFESGWALYSQAYYIATNLGQEDNLHDKIFAVAQNPLLGLNSQKQMRSFFLNNGISAVSYDQAANNPNIAQMMSRDNDLLKSFKITEIPIVLVAKDNKIFLISNRTVAQADPKTFVNTLTQLTQKT